MMNTKLELLNRRMDEHEKRIYDLPHKHESRVCALIHGMMNEQEKRILDSLGAHEAMIHGMMNEQEKRILDSLGAHEAMIHGMMEKQEKKWDMILERLTAISHQVSWICCITRAM